MSMKIGKATFTFLTFCELYARLFSSRPFSLKRLHFNQFKLADSQSSVVYSFFVHLSNLSLTKPNQEVTLRYKNQNGKSFICVYNIELIILPILNTNSAILTFFNGRSGLLSSHLTQNSIDLEVKCGTLKKY